MKKDEHLTEQLIKLQQEKKELLEGLKSAVKFVQVLEEKGHITGWTGKEKLDHILNKHT